MRDTPYRKEVMEIDIVEHVVNNPAVKAAVMAVVIIVVLKIAAFAFKTIK